MSGVSGKAVEISTSTGRRSLLRVRSWLTRISPAWLLILPLFLLLPTIADFPYPSPAAEFSDLTISHYPNAIYLRNTIRASGTVPLWSGTILGGYPFAANPLSGLWYPPGWLALLLPLPLGFNLLVGLHLVLGACGLYLLLRDEGLTTAAALLAGLSFGLLPKLFAHYGAGHLTLLYAVPLTPWLLFSQRKIGTDKDWRRVLPALVLGMIFLADVRWGAFALVTWWAYALVHRKKSWWPTVQSLVFLTLLGLLIASPQLVPLIEYSALSTRAALTSADVLSHSLPFAYLAGLIFRNTGTNHEWVLYSGSIITLLAMGGLMLHTARRRKYFWGGLSLLAMFLALGSQIPGAGMITALPLLNWIRVPSRFLFLSGLAITCLAAYGMDAVLKKSMLNREGWFRLLLFGVSLFGFSLAAGFAVINGSITRGLLSGAIGLAAGALWTALGLTGKLKTPLWIAGVFVIAVLDLVLFDLDSFSGREAEMVLSERNTVVEYIASQAEGSRTYSPSYSLPQQTAVHGNLRLADGVDPLQLADYADFMDRATGVPRHAYTVTLPPFENAQPKTDNVAYLPDAELLGLLNVGYLASDFEIKDEGLIFDRRLDGVYIYRNARQKFSAWVEHGEASSPGSIHQAEIITSEPNRIEVTAEGPGILVLSEIVYPGWRVRVDGVEKDLLVKEGILMGVALDSGLQQVEFEFRPHSVYLGLLLFASGLVLFVLRSRRAS